MLTDLLKEIVTALEQEGIPLHDFGKCGNELLHDPPDDPRH
jgi:hypothetical protein